MRVALWTGFPPNPLGIMETSKNAAVIVCRVPGNLGAAAKVRESDKIDPERQFTHEMSMVYLPQPRGACRDA